MTQSRACTIVFAKAPITGAVKRRLIPAIGAEAACRLHELMVEHGVAKVVKAGLGDVQLWCAPDTQHPLFHALQQRYSISLHKQTGNDLGERMHHAFDAALRDYRQVLIVGTDCPFLNTKLMAEAINALAHADSAVITPAHDGGYVLLGLSRNERHLFDDMEWGTAQVCQETLSRLDKYHYQCKVTNTIHDIDRYEDLLYLKTAAKEAGLNGKTTAFLDQVLQSAGQ